MPLPNPDYLTNEYFYWDEQQFPAVLLADNSGSPAVTGDKRNIRWDFLDSYDRQRVHDLIMGYVNRTVGSPTLTEATAVTGFVAGAAYHTVDYNELVNGGDATGLTAGVNYTFLITLNGTTTTYTINGTNGDTFTNLVAAINAVFPVTGSPLVASTLVASIFNGNIEITTIATGAGEVVEIVGGSLFKSTTGYVGLKEKRVGVSTIEDVFDLNFRDGYQTYTSLLIGKLRTILNKPTRGASTVNDIYFNHGVAAWLIMYDDSVPV